MKAYTELLTTMPYPWELTHITAHHPSQQDPNSGYTAQVLNTDTGGNYESFAFDKDDPVAPRFFTSK